MAKTLRVRTRDGWVTKPAPDEPENRLTAEEVDDNFLEMEDALDAKKSFEVGHALLAARKLTMPGWLPMDGSKYSNSEYPLLGGLMDGDRTYAELADGAPAFSEEVLALAFVPGNRYLVVIRSVNPRIRVIDLQDMSIVPGTPTLSIGTPTGGCRATPDGQYVFIGVFSGLVVLQVSDWTIVPDTPSLGDRMWDVTFTADSSTAYVGISNSPGFLQIDIPTWSIVPGTPVFEETVYALDLNPDETLLAIGYNTQPRFGVYTLSDWSFSEPYTFGNTVRHIDFSPDGTKCAVGATAGSGNTFTVFNVPGFSRITETPDIDNPAVVYTNDGKYVLAITKWWSDSNTRLRAVSTEDWSEIPNTYDRGAIPVNQMACSHDDTLVAIASDGGNNLHVVNAYEQTVFTIPLVEAPSNDLEWRIKAEDV